MCEVSEERGKCQRNKGVCGVQFPAMTQGSGVRRGLLQFHSENDDHCRPSQLRPGHTRFEVSSFLSQCRTPGAAHRSHESPFWESPDSGRVCLQKQVSGLGTKLHHHRHVTAPTSLALIATPRGDATEDRRAEASMASHLLSETWPSIIERERGESGRMAVGQAVPCGIPPRAWGKPPEVGGRRKDR